MFWKSKLTPKSRIRLLLVLGPLSGLAFILSVFLGRLQNPDLDFISGFLIGFAIVGNLATIYVTTRYMQKSRSPFNKRYFETFTGGKNV